MKDYSLSSSLKPRFYLKIEWQSCNIYIFWHCLAASTGKHNYATLLTKATFLFLFFWIFCIGRHKWTWREVVAEGIMDFFRFTIPSRPQAELPVLELIFLIQMSISIVIYSPKIVNLIWNRSVYLSWKTNFCKSSSPIQVFCTIINIILTSGRKITCNANFGFSQKIDFLKAD